MDLKSIQDLIKLVKKAELSELSVKEGDFEVTIKNKGADQPAVMASPMQVVQPAVKTEVTTETRHEAAPAQKPAEKTVGDNMTTFRSPMVGTFYRKPGADKDPYVKVGDHIKAGDVLCIIEAMKLFNEIEYDGPEGKIIKVLAEDASPVEYDQPLFLIEK
ncbi:MAG TPA: acetyl-CoA carboxylase biotin carboxyl carrier protein [Chitinophagales bacterium]|nr:acetyl-CoA carboxylase biotin carboxyl carrier protein [Chitinophagales bacterium]